MTPTSLQVCAAFISRCPQELQKSLISLMPPAEQETLKSFPPSPEFQGDMLKEDLLGLLHPSWLTPYLRTLSEGDVRLLLGALPAAQGKELQKDLGIGSELPEVTRPAKWALRQCLGQAILFNKDTLPPALLPEDPLNRLLKLTYTQLKKVATFLGLHDLSFEMRHIIDSALMKRIYASLPKTKGDYLKTLLLHKEPLITQRLFLKRWDGTKEHLLNLITERGLHRLAHALSFSSKSLKWYVCHKLDIHLGTLLLKFSDAPSHVRAEEILQQQIDEILNQVGSS